MIDSLLEKDFNKRPNIEEVYNYIIKDDNEIELTFEINETNINKKIYFLNNEKEDSNEYNKSLEEMNSLNTELYINNIKKNLINFLFLKKKEYI